MSVRAFALKCEIADSLMRKYLAGSMPGADKLVRIARANNVNIEWLATGEGPMKKANSLQYQHGREASVIDAFYSYWHGSDCDVRREVAMRQFVHDYNVGDPAISRVPGVDAISESELYRLLSSDYAAIPLYNVRAAAGGGAIVENESVVDVLHFKEEWIRNELRANPADLYLIYVDGESMEPTLRPGDVILVDHRDVGPSRDGIYVLRTDGALLVKRLQRLPGGVLRVTSDNTAYEPFNISTTQLAEDFAIIGRVVWAGRRM